MKNIRLIRIDDRLHGSHRQEAKKSLLLMMNFMRMNF